MKFLNFRIKMIWPSDLLSSFTWCLLVLIIVLIKYYLHRKWSLLKNLNVPHIPPSIRNFGSARAVWSEKPFTFDLECKEKFGRIYGYYIMTKPRIAVHDLNILQQIFVKDFSNFTNRVEKLNPFEETMSNGLLFIEDEQWKRVRTTMTPAFSSLKLKLMKGIVERCVSNTIDVLGKKCKNENGIFNVKDVFGRLSLDVICASAFSTDVNSQDTSKKEPQISIQAKELFKAGFFNIYFLIGILFPFLETFIGKILAKKSFMVYFKQLCNRIINQRDDHQHGNNRVDLMQIMLDYKVSDTVIKKGVRKGMSEIEVIANSVTMLLAGYDTTSIAMANLIYNLAQYQDVQEKLHLEIDEVFRKKDGNLDYDSVNELNFLELCINESIRLYPPIAKTTRVAKKEINIHGLTIPAGMLMVMPIHALCHDPEYWDDPMEFKPERMKYMDGMNPMVYQPFGSGPRNCIGKRFALMEMKIAICKLLHQYKFIPTSETPKPPLRLKFDLTVHPKDKITLKAIPRQNHSM
ncbi:cytochrome P450 3A29-like isoform X1 [Styela clava]